MKPEDISPIILELFCHEKLYLSAMASIAIKPTLCLVFLYSEPGLPRPTISIFVFLLEGDVDRHPREGGDPHYIKTGFLPLWE